MKLEAALDFIRLTNAFRLTERDLMISDRNSFENDVEHSYQLAMFVWYLSEGTTLNKEKLLKYALAHDLVEIYAGDTPPFTSSSEHIQSKSERELTALEKITSQFPDFGEMSDTLEQYEKKSDPESIFVYTIDKIMPILNELTFGNIVYYKKNKVTLEKWKSWLKKKMESVSAPEPEIIKELLQLLEQKEKEIFSD